MKILSYYPFLFGDSWVDPKLLEVAYVMPATI